MAKSQKNAQMPVKGGVKKMRYGISMSGNTDSTVIRYNALGYNMESKVNGLGGFRRHYIPGFGATMSNPYGSAICSYYSTGIFKPGTTITYEPSVSFTTPGRVVCGFTDNPEVISLIEAKLLAAYAAPTNVALWTDYVSAVQSLGSVRTFPVWQETQIPFPTKLRRKRFDVNTTITNDANIYDRSCQCTLYVAFVGTTADINPGILRFHDVVDVEGIQPAIT